MGQGSAHLALGNLHSVRCSGKGAGEEQTLRAKQRLQQELGSRVLLRKQVSPRPISLVTAGPVHLFSLNLAACSGVALWGCTLCLSLFFFFLAPLVSLLLGLLTGEEGDTL